MIRLNIASAYSTAAGAENRDPAARPPEHGPFGPSRAPGADLTVAHMKWGADARRTRAIIAAPSAMLSAALLLSACGGGGNTSTGEKTQPPAGAATAATARTSPAPTAQPSPAGAEIDPCALVTKAEIEAAVGTAVLDPKSERLANLASCSFHDPAAPIFSLASVTVFAAASESDAREIFDLAKGNAADVQEVDGLGDDAYWDDILGTLQVLEGTYEISVDVASGEGADQRRAAEDIAARALSRLP